MTMRSSSSFLLAAVALLSGQEVSCRNEAVDLLQGPDIVVASPNSAFLRILQEGDGSTNNNNNETGFADPVVICNSLNEQLKNSMNCTCGRYGKRGVDVKCMGLVDICNSDNTFCAKTSFQYMSDDEGKPLYVTSCTNLTTAGLADPVDSCVQVIAATPGNFSKITECYATLNEETCTCTVGQQDTCAAVSQESRDANQGAGAGTNSTAHVSIDCCRHMDGARATCLPVTPTGLAAVVYDEASDEQQCKMSSAPAIAPLVGVSWATATLFGGFFWNAVAHVLL
jgi:hypothetical protein